MLKTFIILFAVLSVYGMKCEEDDDDVFVATDEWQVVKKGQKIPKGLHVRINLETGVTEAKLLESEDTDPNDKNKAISVVPQDSLDDPEEHLQPKIVTKSHLEEAIKNIKSDDVINPNQFKEIKDKYRSYDEIKEALDELNLTPKLDSEIITELLQKHEKLIQDQKAPKDKIVNVLEDLEFLAHQYDNAIEFVQQKGFQSIIYKNLNSTVPEIRGATLKLMGSLMQNNNKPKIHAFETGAVGVLLRVINLDSDTNVQTLAVTALSALLRSFPVAQQNFVSNGGLSVVSKFFDTDNVKIQLKIVTMISDLVTEHKFAMDDKNLKQFYTFLDIVPEDYLGKEIVDHNWCDNLNKLLLKIYAVDMNDHDSIEKCLTAMHTLKDQCKDAFKRSLLVSVQRNYEMLVSRESENDDDGNFVFYDSLRKICDEILQSMNSHNVKTEL